MSAHLQNIEDAMGHLRTAISQSLPTDDQIIMDHVKEAHALLKAELRHMRHDFGKLRFLRYRPPADDHA